MSFRYAVVTFGCRVNQADSLSIEESLLGRGGQPSPPADAQLIIVNTCSVTASADQAARQMIRQFARQNPSARIVVTGCYATRRPDDIGALPGVIHVVPNELKDRLIDHIELNTAERFGAGDGACGEAIAPGLAGRTAYTLRVQTGCEERCSYCIIPSTRGRSRSRPLSQVLDEIARVAGAGFKEIALTGVHLGSYGRDLEQRSSLLALLSAIEYDAPPSVLFRVSSLEPMDCSEEIVRLVARSNRFAPHFHLPLQHASDRVLAAMHRPYTLGYYQRLVDGIRTEIPDASIGSDIIVGFPGETRADAELLYEYLERSPLTHLHVFPYSDRSGTGASTLPSKVHGSETRERAARVRAIGRSLAERFHASQAGTIRRALTIDDGTLVVTDNYLKIRVAEGLPRNEWTSVRVPSPRLPPSLPDAVYTS